MKLRRKVLAFVLVIVLIFSMSVLTLAATISSGSYNYTVTKTSTNTLISYVGTSRVNHIKGTADTISYKVAARMYSFDSTQLSSYYSSGLLDAYEAEGFVQSLAIVAAQGVKTISASSASGTYDVALRYNYGEGTWSVGIGSSTTLASGEFDSAPISYSMVIVRIS